MRPSNNFGEWRTTHTTTDYNPPPAGRSPNKLRRRLQNPKPQVVSLRAYRYWYWLPDRLFWWLFGRDL